MGGNETIKTDQLHVFLDSNSLDQTDSSKQDLIKRLIVSNADPFVIKRTPFPVDSVELRMINVIEHEKQRDEMRTIEMMDDKIFKNSLSDGEREFLYLMMKHSAITKPYKDLFVGKAIYVTENPVFLSTFIHISAGRLRLVDFFPHLRLVDTERALEVLDIYAKTLGLYFGTKTKKEMMAWYQLFLYSKLTRAPVAYKNTIVGVNKSPSANIQALVFRLWKVLICVDFLGTQHYFGHSRKATTDLRMMLDGLTDLKKGDMSPEGLEIYIDLDDMIVVFYHVEYLISMTTGVFDNLAEEAATLHHISPVEANKVSLSKSGEDFLKELGTKDPNLKHAIDAYRDFINLIYAFREKVVHQEGLTRRISPVAPHWSNFIVIDHGIQNYINQCGDSPSIYKTLTEWGVRHFDTNIYLDPYFFAKNVASRLIRFTENFLELLGRDDFSNYIDQSDEFLSALRHFQEYGLRTLK